MLIAVKNSSICDQATRLSMLFLEVFMFYLFITPHFMLRYVRE